MKFQQNYLALILVLSIICIQINGKLVLEQEFQDFKPQKLGSVFDFLGFNSKIRQETSCNEIEQVQTINPDQKFSYSGYLKFKKNSNSLLGFTFYGAQSAKSEGDLASIPIILFLNGGPGSSSQIGNFEELGPIKLVQEGGKIVQKPNEYSWTKKYSVLFVDQPIGTGMSYAEDEKEIPLNMEQTREDFLQGLKVLFEKSCLHKLNIPSNIPLYIAGESYAGKYIPAIAEAMLFNNKSMGFNLQGIAIGDAFTDPIAISEQYADYTFNKKLVTQQQREYIRTTVQKMKTEHLNKNPKKANAIYCNLVDKIRKFGHIKDIYNYKSKKQLDDLTEKFLQSEEGINFYKLNKDIPFNEQSMTVYQILGGDFLKQDCFNRLQKVINSGLKVLVYNGRNDVIVCEECTLSWFNKLKVKTSEQEEQIMSNLELQNWRLSQESDDIGGSMKEFENLSLILIDDAGHLVPRDKPYQSQKMMYSFIKDTEVRLLKKQQNSLSQE